MRIASLPAHVAPLDASVRKRFHARLRTTIESEELDGLLLLRHPNVVWASGFDHSPSERPVGWYLPLAGEPVLFVPLLEREHAAEVPDVEVETYEEFPGITHPVVWMRERIVALFGAAQRVGVDALDIRVHRELEERSLAFTPSGAADIVRAVKEPEELDLIRAAARYADACLAWILEEAGAILSAGGTELDVLAGGVGAARAQLIDELGSRFAPGSLHVVGTVHTGPRAALPHGRTSARRPQSGEPLIAGIGAKVGGYHAESGATFVLGEPDAERTRCLAAADACGRAAIDALRPGRTCVSVHDAAMRPLAEAGLSPHVRHRIGHAMGVEGHEAPWLAPGDETILLPGMVFSNEPGIYRPGVDGYRTIDSMIVTHSEPEIPSRFQATTPWDQRVIPLD